MFCPRCRSELVAVEAEKVELDWCPACEGVWFDAGEIELLLGCDRPVADSVAGPAGSAGEADRRCPRCPRLMRKVSLGSVTLDSCPDGHGLWFDAGELGALDAAASEGEARRVVAHLRGIFTGGANPERGESVSGEVRA